MTNLIKSLAMMFAVLLTSPIAVTAQAYSDTVSPITIGSIRVYLRDEMRDACWTNLREAREYAEEKLVLEGYNVVDEGGTFVFQIFLEGERMSDGSCFGKAEVDVSAGRVSNGLFGFFEVGSMSTYGFRPDNFNQVVLEMTSAMIEGM